MPRVFVVNQPTPRRSPGGFVYDVSPAMKYGEVEFVFTADQQTPSDNPEAAIEHAARVLADATEDDYLVWAGGDPLGLVIVSSILADITDGPIRYLRWERARENGERKGGGYYAPILINVFHGEPHV